MALTASIFADAALPPLFGPLAASARGSSTSALVGWRLAMRAACTGHVYGAASKRCDRSRALWSATSSTPPPPGAPVAATAPCCAAAKRSPGIIPPTVSRPIRPCDRQPAAAGTGARLACHYCFGSARGCRGWSGDLRRRLAAMTPVVVPPVVVTPVVVTQGLRRPGPLAPDPIRLAWGRFRTGRQPSPLAISRAMGPGFRRGEAPRVRGGNRRNHLDRRNRTPENRKRAAAIGPGRRSPKALHHQPFRPTPALISPPAPMQASATGNRRDAHTLFRAALAASPEAPQASAMGGGNAARSNGAGRGMPIRCSAMPVAAVVAGGRRRRRCSAAANRGRVWPMAIDPLARRPLALIGRVYAAHDDRPG